MNVDNLVDEILSDATGKPNAASKEPFADLLDLLISLSIPAADAKVYVPDLVEHGYENPGLLAHIEKEDFDQMPGIKKIAHKKAILKWASAAASIPAAAAAAAQAAAAAAAAAIPSPRNTTTSKSPESAVPPASPVLSSTSTKAIIEDPPPPYTETSQRELVTASTAKASVAVKASSSAPAQATAAPTSQATAAPTTSVTPPPASDSDLPPPPAPAPEAPAEKKKPFSVKASPPCVLCGKTVYKTEETTNSKGAIFHKECLRCTSCKTSLAGKEPVTNQIGPIRTAQYRIEEGTGNYLCEKHAVARVNVVQGANKDTKSRRQSEIERIEKETHDKNLQVRDSMQFSIGDLTPVCNRCGFALEKDQEIVVSGMERFHVVCPTAEEAAKMIRSVRYFAKKLPERLATTFICDKVTKAPHTFLYELDKESVTEAMKLQKHETAVIVFKPDMNARVSVKRKLLVPGNGNRDFELTVREMDGFSFEDIKSRKGDKPGPIVKPQPNKEARSLELKKYKLENGVLQTMAAKYTYDESQEHIEPQTITFTLEMWPPFDPEKEKANDPLAALRNRMKMRETRGESLANESDTLSEAPPPPKVAVTPPPTSKASPSGASGGVKPTTIPASPLITAKTPASAAVASAASPAAAPAPAPAAKSVEPISPPSPAPTSSGKEKTEIAEMSFADLVKQKEREKEKAREIDPDFTAAAEALSYNFSTDYGSMFTPVGGAGGGGTKSGSGTATAGSGGGGLFGRMFGGKKR